MIDQVGQALYVGAGIIMHALFWALGLIPEPKAGRVQELAQFEVDYVFFLNLAAIAATAALLWIGWRGAGPKRQHVAT